MWPCAQIQRAEVVRLPPPSVQLPFTRLDAASNPWRRRQLRHQRERERRILRHPLDDFDEAVAIVFGARDEFERVAMRAVANRRFLVL
jgi:hypothetical protein